MSVSSRTTWLYVAGHDEARLRKALHLTPPADVVIVDLEDAVPPGAIGKAHRQLHLASETYGRPFVVRTRSGREALEDIAQLPKACHGVVLPKAEQAGLVEEASAALAAHDARAELWLLIESPVGIEALNDLIAAASQIAGVMLGSGDLRATTGARQTDDEIELLYPRTRLVYAARARGLVDIVDGPNAEFRDLDIVLRSSGRAKALGMTGKAGIHPAQLGPIRTSFNPTTTEVAWASEILRAPPGASASGGQLIDEATKAQARRVMDLADSREDVSEEI